MVQQERLNKGNGQLLPYTHYAGCAKKMDIEVEMTNTYFQGRDKFDTIEQKLISGYDGYGGAHDNLCWNVTGGFTFYTLNNKFIVENTKTREQTIYCDSVVQLSCIAASVDNKMVAVAEGMTNPQGQSTIYLYSIE